MFDVIDALEILGTDADLVHARPADLDAELQSKGMEPALRTALLKGDAEALHALVRAPDNVCCLINPAEEEEKEGEEEEEEGEEGEEDDDDEKDDKTRKR